MKPRKPTNFEKKNNVNIFLKSTTRLIVYLETPLPQNLFNKLNLSRFFFSSNQSCLDDGVGGPPCPPSKYRSPTGECNNVRHRSWANRGDVFLRLLKPEYEDGNVLFLSNVNV